MLAVISTGEGIEPSYVVFRALDVPEEDGYRVLARLVVVDVAGAVRGEIGLAILVLGDLELAACGQSCRGGAGGNQSGAYPSYRPTASCTKSSVSSGRSDGRSAVVRSSWCRNIQAMQGSGQRHTDCSALDNVM